MKYRIRPYIFSKAVYVFHDYLLHDLNRGWENPHGITFEKFREEDYGKLEKIFSEIENHLQLFSLDDVKIRISEGHMFYVAKHKGDVIGYFWLAVKSIKILFFSGTIHLKNDEALSFNALIKKEFRGKGIFNRLKAYAFNDIKRMGYRRVVGFYWHQNSASIRMNERFGSRVIGRVKFYTILSLAFRWHNLTQDTIIFHDGIFIFWKKLGNKLFGNNKRFVNRGR